ncbi:putative entry exclusion protein TrbK-alt [Mesorhizobium retamae]|uniref:Entry exclusion protein TrbK-alt n=1 Tax=Mesorhizobium retamae TaxID=2912854 RepID=A0ABS9QKA9_9HYPH|nr:putative entry exclusion protein TrbK-alt [Mesorhizobium sp. IRAMC:0171]MCG7507888.1 putative entry exclusion protein TrbK-alt [Mesorhizobium sp. IRAMC:0171]
MDGKMLARLGAVVFVAVAITATAIEMTRKEEAPGTEPMRLIEPARNPLREGQRRCQQLGQRAANDPDCLRVWAEARDRFLGRTPQATPPAPNGGK